MYEKFREMCVCGNLCPTESTLGVGHSRLLSMARTFIISEIKLFQLIEAIWQIRITTTMNRFHFNLVSYKKNSGFGQKQMVL